MQDHIIVGLGLAGASIAFKLEEKGRKFMVYEDDSLNSSKVAGGVMNPVILKRFTLAWKADEQLEEAKKFYKKMGDWLGVSIYSDVEIYRKFSTVEEQNNWFEAADKPGLSPFLDTSLETHLSNALPSENSFGKVQGTGRVDTRKLLDTYSEHLLAENKLSRSRFAHEDLKILEDHVEYQGLEARNIVFCEGFGVRNNPYFDYLPMVGNKGEYIIIKCPELQLDVTVKSSVFISPLGNDLYTVGATYNNKDRTPEPSAEAREELEGKLKKLIDVPYEVVDQVAGIRPSSGDRRPLVGRHPEYKNVFCCNGFGSRGVLIAPAAAEELLHHIENSEPISPEINIIRFQKRYLKRS